MRAKMRHAKRLLSMPAETTFRLKKRTTIPGKPRAGLLRQAGRWTIKSMNVARKARLVPVALTIAGSDSGGGAGIQADLKAFAAMGVHGTCAVTAVTAQNPQKAGKIYPVKPEMIRAQLEAVFEELPPAAIKTGMMHRAGVVLEVARFLRRHANKTVKKGGGRRKVIFFPLVVDPVMVSTSGRVLLEPKALELLLRELLPMAALVTPNLAEAEILGGIRIGSVEDMRQAARAIFLRHGCSVLVKGGHLAGGSEAVDVLWDGSEEYLFVSPRVKGIRTHGTGCTYSAAICAGLAKGHNLPQAVKHAKDLITRSIQHGFRCGGHFVLNPILSGH